MQPLFFATVFDLKLIIIKTIILNFIKMKIAKILTSFLIIAILSTSQAFAQKVSGKGGVISEKIDLPTLTGVGLGIAANVYVKQGSSQEITIKGQKNIIDNIKREVSNGTWSIEFEKEVKNHESIKIYITLKTLEDVSIGGSGSIIGEGKFTNLADLDLAIGGSGDIKLNVAAKDINCSIGGSGEIHLEGSGDGLAISIGGSGDIEAYDLSVRKCEISSAGSGDINVNVSEKLDVSMVGSGDVSYKGDPKISKSIVGSGDVERAGSK